jgi:hypothetical protein
MMPLLSVGDVANSLGVKEDKRECYRNKETGFLMWKHGQYKYGDDE